MPPLRGEAPARRRAPANSLNPIKFGVPEVNASRKGRLKKVSGTVFCNGRLSRSRPLQKTVPDTFFSRPFRLALTSGTPNFMGLREFAGARRRAGASPRRGGMVKLDALQGQISADAA